MKWNNIEKGYLGQLIVEKIFILNGFNLFKPVLENGKVDLIVEKHNNYYKLQIKTIQKYKESKLIPLRKISHNMGTYKIKTYTSEDIDFFVGIDLETEDLYIIPVSITSAYNNSISIKNVSIIKIILNKWSLIMETL